MTRDAPLDTDVSLESQQALPSDAPKLGLSQIVDLIEFGQRRDIDWHEEGLRVLRMLKEAPLLPPHAA